MRERRACLAKLVKNRLTLTAARKAASGRGCSVPKSQDGWVEAVRQLYVARRLAVATC